MRFSTSALVLGAASTALALDQQVLGGQDSPFDSIKTTGENWLSAFEDKFGKMTSEAKAVWDEITLLAPEAVESFKKTAQATKPKPHHRKSDKKWDHVVKGADVQGMWVEKDGEKHRKIGGDLKNFNLRAKKVDPSALGVDKVKQYSGYLDDEENDKHLFYCKQPARYVILSMSVLSRD